MLSSYKNIFWKVLKDKSFMKLLNNINYIPHKVLERINTFSFSQEFHCSGNKNPILSDYSIFRNQLPTYYFLIQ